MVSGSNGELERASGLPMSWTLKNATTPELERILDNVEAALKSGQLGGRDAELGKKLCQAITVELIERAGPGLEQKLGLPPRRAPRVRRRTHWPLGELFTADLPEPRWIVPQLLPTGLATLAGRPKVGKSWMALQLAAAVGSGGRFLGAPVEEGPVLFLALEDPPRRLKERLLRMGVPRHADVVFYTDWPALNRKEEGLYELEQCLAESQPRLVVIDTLARAFDARVDWNAVGEATDALGALQRLAHERECCLLTVDHHRKPGLVSDVIDDILGSTGKAAVIDTAWGLYKQRGRPGAVLRVVGRDTQDRELTVQFDRRTYRWEYAGEADGPVLTTAEEEVYEALQELGEATAGQLAKRLGKSRPAVYQTLRRLEACERVAWREIPATQQGGKQILFHVLSHDGQEHPSATG